MSDSVPSDLRYTAEHEWVQLRENADDAVTLRIGITEFAQNALGDVVYVHLKPLGTRASAGDPVGEVESTKSVSDIYAPVAGVVTSHNPAVEEAPELINRDPYGEGWLIELRVPDSAGVDSLLDSTEYGKLITH